MNFKYSDDGDDGELETILNCNNINTDSRSRNDNEMKHDTMKGGGRKIISTEAKCFGKLFRKRFFLLPQPRRLCLITLVSLFVGSHDLKQL